MNSHQVRSPLDFKANLIMGHMIPGGTSFDEFNERGEKRIGIEGEEELVFSFAD